MASMFATNEFRKGLKVEIDGVPYEIVDFQHVSPGKGRAFTRTKLKNMITQNVLERTITSGDKLNAANTENQEVQFLYKDSAGYNFMNNQTYEQVTLQDEAVGNAKDFLQENLVLNILYFNERPIGIQLPTFVNLKIIQTEPAFRGDTVSNSTKPATVETGAVIQVPPHVKEGETIKIDTRDYAYVEKVNK